MTTRTRLRAPVRPRPPLAIKRTWVDLGTTTTRTTLLAPVGSGQLRIARIWIVVDTAEIAEKTLELYFGAGDNAAVNRSKIVDILIIKAAGVHATRIYDTNSIDRSPTGLRSEVVSYRWVTAPANAHRALIEYRAHTSNAPSQITGF